jgi:hypothetical protein
MATWRQFGQELNQNECRGPNLMIQERDTITGMLQGGCTVHECAEACGCTTCWIWNLRKKYITTGTTQEEPCSGQSSMLSVLQKKIIYRKVRAAPKIEYSELAVHSVLVNLDRTTLKSPSKTILWRALESHGLTNYCCKKRPKLSCTHAL